MVLTRAAVPAMLERGGGSVVLVASVNGLVGTTDSAAYGTSKAGLLGLARSIAVDYGPRGIRANALCPGWVVTPMADEEMDELGAAMGIGRQEAYDLATTDVPLRRPATAEEIASCCLFLASDESSIVTGAVLVADGGGLAVALDSGGLRPHTGPTLTSAPTDAVSAGGAVASDGRYRCRRPEP
jgi:NAD(P)-dependent dehydrogenase (short-subunit alcohol dehydrogenase family)